MRRVNWDIPSSLFRKAQDRALELGVSVDLVVAQALSSYFNQELHTLFQVSTSAALVQGLYQGAVQVSRLLEHGNFGLGTFVNLDGEMVILDGVAYRIAPTGEVNVVDGEEMVPYAVVTQFTTQTTQRAQNLANFSALATACDRLRSSDNIFHAFRITGRFRSVRTRIMTQMNAGTGLKEASFVQKEFDLSSERGTLVGLWSPVYAGSFSVPGYHLHYLSQDGRRGGHVLDCVADEVEISVCAISEMHVSLPETKEFLSADLSKDPTQDLSLAEKKHDS